MLYFIDVDIFQTLLFLLYCPYYVQTQDISYKTCISVQGCLPNSNRHNISSIFSKTLFLFLLYCPIMCVDRGAGDVSKSQSCISVPSTSGLTNVYVKRICFRTDGQMAHLIVSTFFSHGLSAKCQIPNTKYTGSVPKTEVKAGPARTDDKFRHNSKTRDCYPLHNSKRISLDERKSWKFFS